MTKRTLLSSLALLLASCAAAVPGVENRYPSLAKRPVESRDFDAEGRIRDQAASDAAGVPADPALIAQVTKFQRQSAAGAAAFDASYAKASAAVRAASGADVSSDPWVDAQVALGDLEGNRDEAVSALAGLDQLYIDRMNAFADGKAQGGEALLDAARADALKVVDSQNDRVDRLKGQLRAP